MELLRLRQTAPGTRPRRHRLHTPAPLCRQQPSAIIPQRPIPVRMPDHLLQLTNVRGKTSRNLLPAPEIHSSLPLIVISTPICLYTSIISDPPTPLNDSAA